MPTAVTNCLKIGNYYYRSTNRTFLQQSITFNVKKATVKILQGGAVTLNVLCGLTVADVVGYRLTTCVYVHWKLAGSIQSYCKNKLAYFFDPPCMFVCIFSYILVL